MSLGSAYKHVFAKTVIAMLAAALLTTVAGINIAVLLLLLIAPWFWMEFRFDPAAKRQIIQFFLLITALSVWDVVTNIYAGESFGKALFALQHDLRPLLFVLALWPIFAVQAIARFALVMLIGAVVLIAGANLIATALGFIKSGQYLWPTMHHLHGQMSVGVLFLLGQMLLSESKHSWHLKLSIVILVVSMLVANERRAGYFLLVAGLPLWVFLNRDKFSVNKYRWWLMAAAVMLCVVAASSSAFQARLGLVVHEISQYMALTPEQRAGVTTSVGIRLQFYTSIWDLLKQSNWVMGVGSINFGAEFSAINYKQGTTPEQAIRYFANFQNPHNEYLFMLATKGVIGLVLYIAIFGQACRLALHKEDVVQRIGLLMFVFLFMLSITFNSMTIDMEEGHFTMLILLIFIAPKSLEMMCEQSNLR